MKSISRREFFWLAASIPAAASTPYAISPSDDAFLEDLSRRAFLFFWDQGDPGTGLVLDRARTDGSQAPGRTADVGSIASTGFALTALCIAAERRWMNPGELLERVRNTLRHLAYEQEHVRGWYYHFVNRKSGERVWKSELSTIDTAILIAGVFTAQQYFESDAEIYRLAKDIYERIDFTWMLDPRSGYLRMGWKPESGFLRGEWVDYNENPILHILALGSPAHAISPKTWFAFARDPVEIGPYRYCGAGPVFTHQFPQAWLGLRGLRDGSPIRDYFENSVTATYAHRERCLELRGMYPAYSENLWGFTPSDSEIGYIIWGSPGSRRDVDGTVVPCAAGGSLMFAPEICLPALRTMHNQFGEYIYGRYGFADAFHPASLWVNPDVLGLDAGITLLSAENLRTGHVWEWFMAAAPIRRAVDRLFRPA